MADDIIRVRTVADKRPAQPFAQTQLVTIDPTSYVNDTIINTEFSMLAKLCAMMDEHDAFTTEVFLFKSLMDYSETPEEAYDAIIRRLEAFVPRNTTVEIYVEAGSICPPFTRWLADTHGSVITYSA